MILVSLVAPRNWHARTVVVSALRADGEPSRFVRSGEHTAFPGRRTTRWRGLSRSPERNLDIHGLNHRDLVIRIQCGQLADVPALRHLPARFGMQVPRCSRGGPSRPAGHGWSARGVRRGRPASGRSRDRDALICVSRRWKPPRAKGDWLSGRAPRSHRGGHWFDPSIAHRARSCSATLGCTLEPTEAARAPPVVYGTRVNRIQTGCRPAFA